jgi:hypothetical protein
MMHLRHLLDQELAGRQSRPAIASVLTARLSDDEWASIQVTGLEEQIHSGGRNAIKAVCDRIVLNRRTYLLDRDRRLSRPRSGKPAGDGAATRRHAREEALASILAAEASNDPDDRFGVRRFRSEVLHGQLLSRRAMDRWVVQELRRQGRPTIRRDSSGLHVEVLAYLTADADCVRHAAVAAKSVLDRLRRASTRFAEWAGWEPAEATGWILTGHVPDVSSLKAEVRHRFPLRARSRIVLTVDPTCTPREVAAAFRRLRREHFGRLRRLTAKHARLGAFAAAHCGETKAVQMAAWNRAARPRDRYRRVSAFARDSRQALRRLTEFGL